MSAFLRQEAVPKMVALNRRNCDWQSSKGLLGSRMGIERCLSDVV